MPTGKCNQGEANPRHKHFRNQTRGSKPIILIEKNGFVGRTFTRSQRQTNRFGGRKKYLTKHRIAEPAWLWWMTGLAAGYPLFLGYSAQIHITSRAIPHPPGPSRGFGRKGSRLAASRNTPRIRQVAAKQANWRIRGRARAKARGGCGQAPA